MEKFEIFSIETLSEGVKLSTFILCVCVCAV